MKELHRRLWDIDDSVRMAEMHMSGMRPYDIGKVLGRTAEAIDLRRRKMGLPTLTEIEKKSAK